MHPMPPRITQKSCRPRVSDRTMVGPPKPTCLLAQLPEPKASNDHRVMKPSSRNLVLAWSVLNARQDHSLSRTEMGWMQATTSIFLGGEGEEFSLDIPSDRTSPLIGLIELFKSICLGKWTTNGLVVHS